MDVLKALRARQPAVEFPKQNKDAPEKHYVLEKELGSYVDRTIHTLLSNSWIRKLEF